MITLPLIPGLGQAGEGQEILGDGAGAILNHRARSCRHGTCSFALERESLASLEDFGVLVKL